MKQQTSLNLLQMATSDIWYVVAAILTCGRISIRIRISRVLLLATSQKNSPDAKVATDPASNTLKPVVAHLAEARQALDALADTWADLTLTEEAGTLRIAPEFWRAPMETRRRLIQRVLLWIAPAAYGPRGHQVSQLLSRLSQGHAATLAGCRFLPEGTNLRALREAKAAQPRVRSTVWDGRWTILGDRPDGAEIGPLGPAGLSQSPHWRATALPRPALLVSPALWLGDTLIAAPLAGVGATSYNAMTVLPWIGRKNTALSH